MRPGLAFPVIILLLAAGAVSPAVQAETSTILIPTLYIGPGSHGSFWWSGASVNNYSELPFASPGVEFIVQCPIPEGCFSSEVPPGEFGLIIAPRPAGGLLLHAPSEVAGDLAFQARFGQGENVLLNGTELPVVREQQFRRGPIHLPSVALHMTLTPVRTTLRVYGVDALPGTTVRIEVRPWYLLTGPPLAAKLVSLHAPPSPDTAPEPVYPAYAQLALQREFPFEQLMGTAFNISIVPLPLESGEVPRIWAFLSTTANGTNEVSIQTPQ